MQGLVGDWIISIFLNFLNAVGEMNIRKVKELINKHLTDSILQGVSSAFDIHSSHEEIASFCWGENIIEVQFIELSLHALNCEHNKR